MTAAELPPQVVLVHPGTGPHVQQTARALFEAGMLAAYVTTFAYQPETPGGRVLRSLASLMPHASVSELERRRITEVPSQAVVTHPVLELARVLTIRIRLGPVAADRVWELAELHFSRAAARRVARGTSAVYAYDFSALESFRAQKLLGGACVYGMPHVHHLTTERLMEEEHARFPELRTHYHDHTRRQDGRRNARRDEEMRLADAAVVNSTFAAEALAAAGFDPARILVIPLGAPPSVSRVRRQASGARPLIFLSAGSQSIHRGTHYLLKSWRLLNPGPAAELWLVGTMKLPSSALAGLPANVRVLDRVGAGELSQLYLAADVLVFPSLCESFGMVITEAMAHGLPVITTPNTGGPDLISPGREGMIVPIRDAEALATAMQWMLDNRSSLCAMSARAQSRAAGWQWSAYRAILADRVTEALAGRRDS
jgi:glycosyltransferase involved in cell wall biosynthesis